METVDLGNGVSLEGFDVPADSDCFFHSVSVLLYGTVNDLPLGKQLMDWSAKNMVECTAIYKRNEGRSFDIAARLEVVRCKEEWVIDCEISMMSYMLDREIFCLSACVDANIRTAAILARARVEPVSGQNPPIFVYFHHSGNWNNKKLIAGNHYAPITPKFQPDFDLEHWWANQPQWCENLSHIEVFDDDDDKVGVAVYAGNVGNLGYEEEIRYDSKVEGVTEKEAAGAQVVEDESEEQNDEADGDVRDDGDFTGNTEAKDSGDFKLGKDRDAKGDGDAGNGGYDDINSGDDARNDGDVRNGEDVKDVDPMGSGAEGKVRLTKRGLQKIRQVENNNRQRYYGVREASDKCKPLPVGTVVRMKLPRENITKLNDRKLIGRIVENKQGGYVIGTSRGILKGLWSSVEPVVAEAVLMQDIPQKKITMQEYCSQITIGYRVSTDCQFTLLMH